MNKKIKTVIAVLCALSCCAFLFAACSFMQGDENDPEPGIEKAESYEAYLFTYDEFSDYRRARDQGEDLSQFESRPEIYAGESSSDSWYGDYVFMIEYERSGDWGESISNYFSFTLKSAGALSPVEIERVYMEEDHNGSALGAYAYTKEIDVVMDLPEEYWDSGIYSKDCVPYLEKYNSLPLRVPEGKETVSDYIAFCFTPECTGTIYIEYKLWSEESQEYEWREENIFSAAVLERGKTIVPASVSGLSFGSVSEEEYYGGDIAENLNNVASMEIGLGGKSYFVIDFDILAQADSSGMSTVGLSVYFSDTSWCDITVEEAPSSDVSVSPSGKGTAVEIAFRIPERADAAESRRSVISILPSGNGYCSVDIFVYNGMSEEYAECTSLRGAQWLKADIQTQDYVADFRYEPTGDGYMIYGEAQALKNRETLVIPDFYRGLPVKAIGEGAFAGLGVRTVTLGNNIESIGKNAFAGCTALEEVIALGKNDLSVGESAFKGCTALLKIEQESLIKLYMSVGASSFEGCVSLRFFGFYLDGVWSRGFADCTSLVNVTLRCHTGETYIIGSEAFINCSALRDVDLNYGLYQIGSRAFSNTSVEELHMPDTLRIIQLGAFEGCDQLMELDMGTAEDWYLFLGEDNGPREEADLVVKAEEWADYSWAAKSALKDFADYNWICFDR